MSRTKGAGSLRYVLKEDKILVQLPIEQKFEMPDEHGEIQEITVK